MLLAWLLIPAATSARPPQTGESEPVLAAVDLVRPALLSGPGHRVLPRVPVHGFMAQFTLDTPFGPILAESREMLEIRAAEMAALQILVDTGLGQAFGIALRENLQDSAASLARVVRHPVATAAGLPVGVLRYFQRQAGRWGNRLSRHGDRIAHGARNDGDPYDMAGPMTAGRDARPERPRRRWFGRIGREAGRQAEDLVSHGSARRMLARELGVDPYAATSNPPFNAALDRLAWAAAAGSFGLSELLQQLPIAGRAVLSESGRLNELVWEMEPEDLRRRNGEVLERWCGDAFQIRRFLRHRPFLASVQTGFVDALDALAPAAGCEGLLDLALATEHEVEARFLANATAMLVDRKDEGGRGAELWTLDAGLGLRLADGRLILPLPVDYLSWTDLAGEFFGQPALLQGQRTVLISGGLSDRALRELTALGWDIVTQVPIASSLAIVE